MRSLEIGSTLGEAIAQGKKLAFVTLTLRHDRKQSLGDLWSACSEAWEKVCNGSAWRNAQEKNGGKVLGWVRVWEVTTGRNGWHVHAHAVVVLDESATSEDVERLGSSMFGRWAASAVRSGLREPLRQGQDWHLVSGDQAAEDLGRYLAKLQSFDAAPMVEAFRQATVDSLGMELAYSMPGRSRESLKTRPVWSLLDDLRETGEVGRWREWEKTSKGKRQVGWSRGLRERFALVDEQSDDEIVSREVGSAADTVAVLDAESWSELVAKPRGPLTVLEVVRSDGVGAGLALLDDWGIRWLDPGAGGDPSPVDPETERTARRAAPRTAPPPNPGRRNASGPARSSAVPSACGVSPP